ncbi:response regulator [bacterium]|nr:response regulator [bacterium]
MGKKIVIAEDEEHMGKMISFKLEKEGFEVIWKQNGASALETIREQKPDLALLDVMMPDMNGFEVLKAIRRDESLNSVKVVMLTAKGRETDIVDAINQGAADYVVKPFRPAELLARIKRLLIES